MFKSSSCKAAKIPWPSKVPAHSRAIALDSTLSALVSMQRFVRLIERPSGSLASVFDDDQMGVAKCSLNADRPSSTKVFETSRGERFASALSQQSTANRHPKAAGRHILAVPGQGSLVL